MNLQLVTNLRLVRTLTEADMIIFASPVYWWGITAQLKLVIDKCYCRGAQLKGKKIGLIVVGGASVEAEQYGLIRSQFECMAKYLSWDLLFAKCYSASGKADLAEDVYAISELKAIGSSI